MSNVYPNNTIMIALVSIILLNAIILHDWSESRGSLANKERNLHICSPDEDYTVRYLKSKHNITVDCKTIHDYEASFPKIHEEKLGVFSPLLTPYQRFP